MYYTSPIFPSKPLGKCILTDAFVPVGEVGKARVLLGVNLEQNTQREQLQTETQAEGPRKATPL